MSWLLLVACGGLDRFAGADADCAQSPRLLRRLTHDEYAASVGDLFNVDVDPASFAADPVVDGFRNDAEALVVTDLLAEQYRSTAESVGDQVDLGLLLACDRSVRGDAGCAAAVIEDLGFEVFRRPLTQVDIDAYLELWTDVATEDGYDEGLRWVVIGMLQSPHFLYRSELGEQDDDGAFSLTKWELATALSYSLLGTTPSRDLLDRVSDGLLEAPADVAQVSAELLTDPRALSVAADFVEVWLDTGQLETVSREGLTPELRDAMRQETRDLVIALASADGTLSELLTTAASSGGPAEDGGPADAGTTDLDVSLVAGVLTQASVLTAHGRPLGSGPVQRGVFVRERLLCEDLPPPPSNLNVAPPEADLSTTTREQYASHSADPACVACHDRIDPLGFAFEHYDQLGAYRALDNGFPIDDSGDIDGVPFSGPAGLAEGLLNDERFRSCFVSTWRRHATGLPACGEDQGVDVTILGPLAELSGLPGFAVRTGGEEEGDSLAAGDRAAVAPPEDVELPPGGIELALDTSNDWGSGYCAEATVTNTGDEPALWVVSTPVDGAITNLWDAVVKQDGDNWLFSGATWNRQLAPGASTHFGFCANR
jgi:Protein of unknown function (DUF1588)/Protein of unknown function (DUF1592)/Protein of unknown function (DUF1587)/Protein of unknown function (DUF1595)/Cellulose binding domain